MGGGGKVGGPGNDVVLPLPPEEFTLPSTESMKLPLILPPRDDGFSGERSKIDFSCSRETLFTEKTYLNIFLNVKSMIYTICFKYKKSRSKFRNNFLHSLCSWWLAAAAVLTAGSICLAALAAALEELDEDLWWEEWWCDDWLLLFPWPRVYKMCLVLEIIG